MKKLLIIIILASIFLIANTSISFTQGYYSQWSMDFQNNWESWPQSNTPSINSSWLERTPFYIPDNQQTDWISYNAALTRNPFYELSFLNSDAAGLPNLSKISYYSATDSYYAPGLTHWNSSPQHFRSGAIFFGTNDITGENYELHFFREAPAIYTNSTLITEEGSSQLKTINIEDDGKTFTFLPGEMFRIVLPMYDDISKEDFPLAAGWIEKGHEQVSPSSIDFFGFEPKIMGLAEDESGNLIQENTYRALKESANVKTLIFNYHSNGQQKDTFSVTIQIRGSGIYSPSY